MTTTVAAEIERTIRAALAPRFERFEGRGHVDAIVTATVGALREATAREYGRRSDGNPAFGLDHECQNGERCAIRRALYEVADEWFGIDAKASG